MSVEDIRAKYRPDPVRILLVGESAPTSGKTFFYEGNSRLFRHWEWAFAEAAGERFPSPRVFLEWLRSRGIFLDDLLTGRVPADPKERRHLWASGVMPLAGRLATYRPEVIVVVMRGIADYVADAVRQAGLSVETRTVNFPFPGKHYEASKAQALEVAHDLNKRGFLRPSQ